MDDRTVHVTIPCDPPMEVVRYDRAGTWWVESVGLRPRRILLAEAVRMADPNLAAVWHEGRPGGTRFDAAVRKMRGE